MGNYLCPNCRKSDIIGMEIIVGGNPKPRECDDCGTIMEEIFGNKSSQVYVGEKANVNFGSSSINVGGSLINKGKIKMNDTNLSVRGDLHNIGDFLINDPEKIKEALLEISKATKNLTDIGKMVSEKIFGRRN